MFDCRSWHCDRGKVGGFSCQLFPQNIIIEKRWDSLDSLDSLDSSRGDLHAAFRMELERFNRFIGIYIPIYEKRIIDGTT